MLYIWSLFFSLTLFAQYDLSQMATSREDDQIIDRSYYQLSYNNHHEVANWVAYSLELIHLKSCVSRTDDFRLDPQIIDGSAVLSDYSGSGFDRGHLVPAGDMKFNRKAMSETFYLSNMTPQPAHFNRGQWSRLENLIRSWALKYKKIWVITGPVLTKNLPTIGKQNNISVPELYYKVVLKKEAKGFSAIGLLMSTDTPYPQLDQYAVTIDEIEKIAGVDFFSSLPQKLQAEIESQTNFTDWDFKANFSYLPCN